MIYKVGEPSFLLKKNLSNSFSISCPSLLTGLTIVIFLSFCRCTSPVHFLFLYALFYFMVGQSITILSDHRLLKSEYILENLFLINQFLKNGVVSFKIYDRRGCFGFEKVGFPFLDGNVPRSPSCGVCVSQLVRFAGVCSGVDGFSSRYLFLTAKLLRQGCGCCGVRRAFSKFYRGHLELIVKYNVGFETLLQQGMSEPVFCGDLVCRFKRIV